jgi:hypothetical protein
MWARLEDNIVKEVINFDPADKFTGNLTWVECDGATKEFMVFENGSFREPDAPVDIRPYNEKRALEYPSVDELVVALWEGVVEERMAAVTKLEIKRQAVKAKHPK